MQDTRYILLVLLSSLLMLTGCSRRELLDDYPVSGVDIKLDWNGVTDKLSEGVRVIFYPKSAEGRKIDTYLTTTTLKRCRSEERKPMRRLKHLQAIAMVWE